MSDDLYARFNREKSRAENDWIRNFVLPFSNAYIDARARFMEKIDEQKKADEAKQKRIAELAMTVLAFCGGQLMTGVFASAALKTHAAEFAVDYLYKHNMNRTFTALAFMTENKTAQLALGKLWEKGKDLLSSQLKKQLEESDENYPALADFALDPLKMRNHLEKYVRDVLARVLLAEKEISERVSDPTRKYNAIENLIEAPFFSTAPVKSLAGGRTSDEMELAFYMQYLLTVDYVSHGHYKYKTMKGDSFEWYYEDSKQPIAESPTSDKYPQTSRTGMKESSVVYGRVGGILRKRIDELAKQLLGGTFFLPDEHVSRSTLQRAESKLTSLAASNIDVIKKNFSGPVMVDAISGAG